jgi:uncharacterized membrane protein YdjX (TVP38/TMEM64 family)
MQKSKLLVPIRRFFGFRRTWAALALLPAVAWLAWRFGPQLWVLVQDRQAIEAFVAGLGWLGPLALIAINALQIVAAPIPGYVVQAAAGFLFGPFWGGVWGSIGLLTGGMLAMGLTRLYGRPLAERMVGQERLAGWEEATYSDSTLIWGLILLAPVGDVPYFLAGLARVGFLKILILSLITRVPTVFVVAAAAAGVVVLAWWQVFLILTGLLLMFWALTQHRERLATWIDRQVNARFRS